MSALAWAGRHGRAVVLGSLVVALALLVGGLALGMSQGSSSAAPQPNAPETPPVAVAKLNKHFLIGVVVQQLAPRMALVRTAAGRFIVVESDASTVVRRTGAGTQVTNIVRGTKVTVLGNPQGTSFRAKIVTITGQVVARPTDTPTRAPAQPRQAPRPRATPAPDRTTLSVP